MSINVILAGANGRMGKTIADMLEKDSDFKLCGMLVHSSELKIVSDWAKVSVSSDLSELAAPIKEPVIIDFTSPESSLNFAAIAAKIGARQVIGTTGLNKDQQVKLKEYAEKTPILWSPNMSIGVNVLFKILPELVRLLGTEYDAELMEIHHNKKKDSPSGTAVRLAEILAQAKGWDLKSSACYHREGIIGERPEKEIGIQTLRGGDVVGVHTTYFMGPGERIELTHHAHSRDNFASGALRAAKWLSTKKPGKIYSILDLF